MKWTMLICGVVAGLGVGYALPHKCEQSRYLLVTSRLPTAILLDNKTGETWAIDSDGSTNYWVALPRR